VFKDNRWGTVSSEQLRRANADALPLRLLLLMMPLMLLMMMLMMYARAGL
jgi:hypothetical protein